MPIVKSKKGFGFTYKYGKKHSKKMPNFLKVFIILSILIVIGVSGFLASSFLTDKFGIFKIKICDEKKFFAIKVYESESYDDCLQYSKEALHNGGAGKILKTNNNFAVFISFYDNFKDAEKVQINSTNSGINCEITELKLSSLYVKKFNGDIEIMKKTLNLFTYSISELYTQSVLFDTEKYDIISIKNNLTDIYKNVEISCNEFSDKFKTDSNSNIIYLKIRLQFLKEHLTKLLNQTENFSGFIKLTYFNVFDEFCLYVKEIV